MKTLDDAAWAANLDRIAADLLVVIESNTRVTEMGRLVAAAMLANLCSALKDERKG